MDKQIVLIIGGPGSGKTTLINHLSDMGYICYPEISRQVTLEAQKRGIDQLFLAQPLLFSELLLQGRIEQHKQAQKESTNLIFIDRGIPDVLAYMHYIGDCYPENFDRACKEYNYSKVFLLPPWEHIYESDEARYENFEQASVIHTHLVATYQKYGYELIEVPKDTVEQRAHFILGRLSSGF